MASLHWWVEQDCGGSVGHTLVAQGDSQPQRRGGPGRFRQIEPTPEELDRWDDEWRDEWQLGEPDDSSAYDPAENELFDPFLDFNWEEPLENTAIPDEEDYWMPDDEE